jgi:hypothetical protein
VRRIATSRPLRGERATIEFKNLEDQGVQAGRVAIESTSVSSVSVSSHLAAAALLLACSGEVAPAITDATAGRPSTHEKASSSIVCPRLSENSTSRSTTARFLSVSSLSPGVQAAPRGDALTPAVLPREQAVGEREVGYERYPQAFALGKDVTLRLAVQETVLVLHAHEPCRALARPRYSSLLAPP